MNIFPKLASGSCHFDRVLNVEIGVECQIFVIDIFFNFGQVLQFGAHSRHFKGHKGALTQNHFFCPGFVLLSDLIFVSAEKIKTNIQNSTLNSSFNAPFEMT